MEARRDLKVEALMRPPQTVMRLERMGSFHQTRLSFMRSLLRMMGSQRWRFTRPVWRISDKGVGVAVYRAEAPKKTYSLVAFAHDLDPSLRSDRAIATAWDATFTVFDGMPTEEDLERLSSCVPKQEDGRVSDSELSISRANKSVRLFDHVVERLAAGRQPDAGQLDSVGYLMRTTAVYGSAKFGAASRDKIKARPEASRPFHIEMLSVYLIRSFTVDLAEHLAMARSPKVATGIQPGLRRRLGVGNSTGLGMAPYLVNHPQLIHNWVSAREIALARVRSQPSALREKVKSFRNGLSLATASMGNWRTSDGEQTARIAKLRADLDRLNAQVEALDFDGPEPWNKLYEWAAINLGLEAEELLVSLLIEPFGDLVDDLLDSMGANEDAEFRLNGLMTVGELRSILADRYSWATGIDFSQPANCARFWYVSANKAEPRLGERADEPDAYLYEEPLDIARGVSDLSDALAEFEDDGRVSDFLLRCPSFRKLVRRIQIVQRYPYGEVNDNLISESMRPIDLLRCKLSFFGATDFDPRSDRWTRITMFKNAPYPHELDRDDCDNWAYRSTELA